MKLKAVDEIPRLDDTLREKMRNKIKEQAAAEGVSFKEEGFVAPSTEESGDGVPNWEIEELKSITDGHILLRKPADGQPWSWKVDPYKSLPRLGTDAMHPALLAMGAHKLRLKMFQGRDRANLLHDTLGAEFTLDAEDQIEIYSIELLLDQLAGTPLRVEDEVARLALVTSKSCDKVMKTCKEIGPLASQLLQSERGQKAADAIREAGSVTDEARELLLEQVHEIGQV